MAYLPIPATAVVGGLKPPRRTKPVKTRPKGMTFASDPIGWMVSQLASSFETPAQREARSRKFVDDMIAKQTAAARAATAAQQAQIERQRAISQGYAQAMHGLAGREAEKIAG